MVGREEMDDTDSVLLVVTIEEDAMVGNFPSLFRLTMGELDNDEDFVLTAVRHSVFSTHFVNCEIGNDPFEPSGTEVGARLFSDNILLVVLEGIEVQLLDVTPRLTDEDVFVVLIEELTALGFSSCWHFIWVLAEKGVETI